jgi:ABC-type lipoprotein export system ATPase subunit
VSEGLVLLRRGHREKARSVSAGSPRMKDLVVITGYSGAGNSTAMQDLEDDGYFYGMPRG